MSCGGGRIDTSNYWSQSLESSCVIRLRAQDARNSCQGECLRETQIGKITLVGQVCTGKPVIGSEI